MASAADTAALAIRHGPCGYRRITGMLETACRVNSKRVERIWRREGLKLPAKQPRKAAVSLNDGARIRLPPEHTHNVWLYYSVKNRTLLPGFLNDRALPKSGRQL